MTEDLWGELPNVDNIKTPHAILLEQATLLTEKTKGLLIGTVGRGQNGSTFINALVINAPSLNNYSYTVCSTQHQISLYPLHFFAQSTGQGTIQCNDESQFVAALRTELSAPQTQRVISGLLAQIRADAASGTAQAGDKASVSSVLPSE
jgi:hypothetical protein